MSSCAAILSPVKKPLDISSNPDIAYIEVDGINYGTTPATIHLKPDRTYTVEVGKEGFLTQTKQVTYKAGVGWIIADVFLTGLVGVIVDAATKRWNVLHEKELMFGLERDRRLIPREEDAVEAYENK
jgi:hypothetical protein